ncbi:MAG: heme ABC exporter ATP-binding protein CcmA [Rickettsiaceae bacterium]|nr:heme ABC exporter ATP-binding protein CcmA [Rickettsiaceae bacterium]
MLSLHSLSFALENKIFYQNISMTILPSSIVYIQGKNGAGKTAFLRMLAGIQHPSAGKITFSKDSLPIAQLTKPYCTYIGHRFSIKLELTVLENIEFWAKIYDSEQLVSAAIVYFSLQDLVHKKCYELSAGNQKKVALARLLACQSKLWLLDEVDSNLDATNKQLLLNLIISHADNGGIVFITSHTPPDIKSAQILNISEYSSSTL